MNEGWPCGLCEGRVPLPVTQLGRRAKYFVRHQKFLYSGFRVGAHSGPTLSILIPYAF